MTVFRAKLNARLRQFVENFGYDIHKSIGKKTRALNVLELAMENLRLTKVNPFFIQVGAFDGATRDPIYDYIHKYHWHGILVEPQPGPFKKLVENYRGFSGLIFENVAIAEETGAQKMYVSESDLTLTRFDRASMEGGDVKEIEVKTSTLGDMISRNGIQAKDIDFLTVDAEGYDEFIVRQALDVMHPRLIHFETGWMEVDQMHEFYNYLSGKDYSIFHGTGDPCDTVALSMQAS